ncbi:hypothetical protein [Halapricum sp. CBA1109]|uniref:hypothetical protein n=1 Tax=Halapricum sp. CBA1109 TaxID=2668068 RepID=UPI001E40059C|nr:hypothetical protein [Halapricum sp. CBA1109]
MGRGLCPGAGLLGAAVERDAGVRPALVAGPRPARIDRRDRLPLEVARLADRSAVVAPVGVRERVGRRLVARPGRLSVGTAALVVPPWRFGSLAVPLR